MPARGQEVRRGATGTRRAEALVQLAAVVLGDDDREVTADHLVGGISVERFGAGVPRLDGAVDRQAHDRIARRLDDRGERAHAVLSCLALGDVAERRHDDVAVVAIGHRPHIDLDPHALAIGTEQADHLVDDRLPRAAHLFRRGLGVRAVGARFRRRRQTHLRPFHQRVERHASQLAVRDTQDVSGAAVAVEHATGAVPHDQPLAEGVEDRAGSIFRRRDGTVGVVALELRHPAGPRPAL